MFERFTNRARRVVYLAQEQAEGLNRDNIGTEHLLLGLMGAGDGVAETALEPQRISTVVVRQRIVLRAAQRAGVDSGADPGPVEEIAGQGQLQPPVHFPVHPASWASWAPWASRCSISAAISVCPLYSAAPRAVAPKPGSA